ncbi:hypothetical protein [Flavobacterium franklandianum]|nr:hypothetical protein [Flavobacterium franklandianum]
MIKKVVLQLKKAFQNKGIKAFAITCDDSKKEEIDALIFKCEEKAGTMTF